MGRDMARSWTLGAGVEARNLAGAKGFLFLLEGDAFSLSAGRVDVFRGDRADRRPALRVAIRAWTSLAADLGGYLLSRNVQEAEQRRRTN